ncbi:hypothetical protein PINS_up009674 [Pythium insidiosum]|nr:hypothetical protein PINS_up009674 [Pythium insidiosum]
MTALRVVAFLDDIAAFLSHSEQQRLASTCRLIYATLGEKRWPLETLDSFLREREHLESLVRQLLQQPRGRSRRRSRLRDDQNRVLVRDLALVALGVRPSCLIDVCALDDETITALLTAFQNDSVPWRTFGFHQLRCISLAGNVFFVHVSAFLQLKALDIASSFRLTTFVDASESLQEPQVMLPHHLSIERLLDATRRVLQDLSSPSTTRSIAVDVRGLSATALAGIMLCYPFVYHISPPSNDNGGDSLWSVEGNCLAMRPLHVVQTAIRRSPGGSRSLKAGGDHSTVSFVLQEFSAPQHLFAAARTSLDARSLSRVISTYRSTVERSLLRALARDNCQTIATWQPIVSISTRTLSHVGL